MSDGTEAGPVTAADAEWDALRDDIEQWLSRTERPWRDGGVVGALVTHRARIEEAVRAQRDAELRAAVEGLRQRDDNETDTGFLDRDTVDCILALLSDLAHADTPSRQGGE